jgi:hypothetical protein
LNVGCEDIWIIADADGYQMSLSERKSIHVGQDYRVIPVSLKNGIFHPKCVYLSSKDSDLLIVGSGNLTFGGYGKNLEVAEILTPNKNPQAFIDFTDFLTGLKERDDLLIPEMKWITDFSILSRNAVKSNVINDSDDLHIISNVRESIAHQLISFCKNSGKIKKLYSLSPFYSDDGEAVRFLSEKTDTDLISISLHPNKTEETSFPFNIAKSWKVKTDAVIPQEESIKNDKRPLHAKWIECHVENNKKIILTGSINSTNQALLTTNNIEVGVLRTGVDSDNWITWKKTPIPAVTKQNFFPEKGKSAICIIYANLKDDGFLTGQIIYNSDISGEWTGMLMKPDGESQDLSVNVGNDGIFKVQIKQLERFSYESSLQVLLTQNNLNARGWVHQEDILKITSSNRVNMLSWHRLINREGTEDDEVALLDYLSMHADKHLKIFNAAVKTNSIKKREEDNSESTCINVEFLKPEDGFHHEQVLNIILIIQKMD